MKLHICVSFFKMLFLERSSKESGNHSSDCVPCKAESQIVTVILCNKSYQCSNIWMLKTGKLFTISNLPDCICFVVTEIKYFKTCLCLFRSFVKNFRGAFLIKLDAAFPHSSLAKEKTCHIFTSLSCPSFLSPDFCTMFGNLCPRCINGLLTRISLWVGFSMDALCRQCKSRDRL